MDEFLFTIAPAVPAETPVDAPQPGVEAQLVNGERLNTATTHSLCCTIA